MKVLNLVTNGRNPHLQNQLKAQESAGIDQTTVIVSNVDVGGNVDRRSIWEYISFYPRMLKECLGSYDIIHANSEPTVPFGLLQPNRPIVFSSWGSIARAEGWRLVNQKALKYYDAVIANSEWAAERLPCETEIVHFPFDAEEYYPIEKEEAREYIGWEQDATIVLFPYSKSRDIKNFPLAKSVVKQIQFNPELKALGDVPPDEMVYYLNASDVVLVTSKGEPGPGVVKEAALCNVPVVSTDTGFVSTAVSDVSYSYACSSENELIEKLEEALSYGGRTDGRKKANDWSIETMGEQLVNIYTKTLQS